MNRVIIVFFAGMLVGGTTMHLLRSAQIVDRIVPASGVPVGANAESAAVTIGGTGEALRNAADDNPEATDAGGRDALAALDAALAIENPGDRQRAVRTAIELLDALPALDRAQLARHFAALLAAADPDAAIEWAQSARLPGIVDEVLAVVADSDPFRALELAVDGVGSSVALNRVVRAALDSSATTMQELADALAAAQVADLRMLASTWMERDPQAAIEWMLEQPSDVSSSLLGSNAHYLREHPALAERYLDRVPQQARAQWIRIAAQAFALTDPDAALDWTERFQGSREYSTVRNEVLTSIATYDGALAAAILDSRALWSQGPVTLVVDRWFYYDPDAATAWAAGIPEPFSRRAALTLVGDSWMRRDPNRAKPFIANLPADAWRDGVLDGMLNAASNLTSPNRDNWPLINDLLDAYVSNAAQERQAAQFSTRIARDYEAEARQLMERYVTDPALWNQFEAALTPE